MKFCGYCGKKMAADQSYCMRCGKKEPGLPPALGMKFDDSASIINVSRNTVANEKSSIEENKDKKELQTSIKPIIQQVGSHEVAVPHVGKTCPFCQYTIKPVDNINVCPECGTPHHGECVQSNEGQCTTFGCKGRPQAINRQGANYTYTKSRGLGNENKESSKEAARAFWDDQKKAVEAVASKVRRKRNRIISAIWAVIIIVFLYFGFITAAIIAVLSFCFYYFKEVRL